MDERELVRKAKKNSFLLVNVVVIFSWKVYCCYDNDTRNIILRTLLKDASTNLPLFVDLA